MKACQRPHCGGSLAFDADRGAFICLCCGLARAGEGANARANRFVFLALVRCSALRSTRIMPGALIACSSSPGGGVVSGAGVRLPTCRPSVHRHQL